jgi:hypothetical protein
VEFLMKRLLLIISLIISFTYSAYTEWEQFNNGIEKKSPSINFIKYLGDQLYASTTDYFGKGQGLYLSTNYGDSWKLIGLENVQITSIEKINNQIFVGTRNQGLFYSSNGGKEWEQRNNGLPEGDNTNIRYLTNIGDTLVVSVNDLYYSTDFGITWIAKSVKIEGEKFLTITSLESAGNALMIGLRAHDIILKNYISSDFGNNWIETKFSSRDNDDDFSTFIEYKKKLYFTKYELNPEFNSIVYSSSDNGKNWNSTEIPTKSLVSIGESNDSLLAVGSNGNIYVSLDEGITFNFLPFSHLGPTNTIRKAAIGKRIIGVQNDNNFFYYFDDFWQFNSIDVKIIGEIWSINRYSGNAIIKTDNEIYTSPMNGNQWNKFAKRPNNPGEPDSIINSITTIDDTKIVFFHDHAYSITEDDGLNWERVYIKQNYPLSNVKFFPGINIAVPLTYSIPYQILFSKNNGITWETFSNIPISNMNMNLFVLNNRIYCYSAYRGMYSTSDMGTTWQEMNNGLQNWDGKVFIVDYEICDNSLYIINQIYDSFDDWGMNFLKSDDFGSTFQIIKTNFIPSSLFTIQYKLFVSARQGGLFYTSDKGATWIDKSQGIENVKVLGLINLGEHLYIATNKGVYREKLTEFGLGVAEKELSNSDLISPNPASDYINVDLSFLQRQESEIMIYNIFGECILTTPALRATPPYQGGDIRIDVSALPAGVYFVKVGNEKPIKFVVVR